ncbi:MAG: MBL fold metallo-hydrolase [Candidatus Sungbacteria bacterium]|nr:MBL fold metallo-hydrolase [bacterium]MDZ4286180.1 MBL fold metallo-hydrolase [Candidatus Sungbacteria bacterium]
MKNYKIIFFTALALITVLVWYAALSLALHRNLVIHFFDVGQGDAAFMELPNGRQVLIDGGPGSGILAKLGSVMPFWDRTIDLVIVTHPHADHLDGLIDVLKRYTVRMVIESGAAYPSADYSQWQRLLKEKNVNVVSARAGQHVALSDMARLDILTPTQDFSQQTPANIHDAIVISRISYGSTTILFMGDAEKMSEYQMLFSGMPIASDVLKIGHHGSKTSSVQDFLAAVHPQYAVISVGRKNRYGHPHQEVIERIKKLGISLLRTDTDGDIVFESDGMRIAPLR